MEARDRFFLGARNENFWWLVSCATWKDIQTDPKNRKSLPQERVMMNAASNQRRSPNLVQSNKDTIDTQLEEKLHSKGM